jgi:hypothetical protein
MPILLSEPKKIYYHSNIISSTSVACLLMLVLTLVLTYLVTYLSKGMFIENIVNNIQPNVEFNDQFILNILENDEFKTYSSIIKFNDFYANLLEVPLVKVNYN